MRKILAICAIALASCGQQEEKTAASDSIPQNFDTPSTVQPDTSSETPEPGFAALMQRKKEEGVDFYAIGQEPGWSLDMDTHKIIRFSSYEGTSMNSPDVDPVVKGDTTIYSSSTESGNMVVTIVKGECTDVMSGQKFTHSVTVKVKRGTDKDFKTFKGCGTLVD